MTISKAFALMTTVTANTKRRPSASGGIIGAPVTNLTSIKVTPLDPVDPELRDSIPGLAGKAELLQCYVAGGEDIQEGDILVVSNVDYPIRAVEDWYYGYESADYQVLILEEIK